jgi:hypothetical protein
MSSFEKVGLGLLALLAIVIVALLGPASLGARVGAAVALGVTRMKSAGR